MSVGTPIGTAGFVTPILKTALDVHPHLNKEYQRPNFRGALKPLEPMSPGGAPMKGTQERPMISALEAATMRQAPAVAAAAANESGSIAALHVEIKALRALVASQAAQIAAVLERIDTLDGAAVGEL